jgi:biopolymer transport protein ExbD
MRKRFGKGREVDDGTFDVNVAPVIDCFTVLIAFMLISATFLSIGVLDAGVAVGAKSSADNEKPPISVDIQIQSDNSLKVKIDGKVKRTNTVASIEGNPDREGLNNYLQGLKQKWPKVEGATLSAVNGVPYNSVVNVLAVTRKTLPAVILGGF